ncbi:MAG: glycosyltransferase family 2 protein [Candidatus Korobacteraceae bacterium]|jgi:glycosyltransferase involved in cell wall biosynthesis
MPLVSILMTAYNREAFIADAIQSVLAQTFTDFELIIVDDGSKDRTVEIARRYGSRDRRIRVFVNERNLGDYPNRNRAASLASGTFLKYHDSDDLLYPHCLAVMVPLLASHPQASFALSPGAREWSGGPCPMLLTPRMCYQREFLGGGMFHLGPACALFRAEAFRRLGYFPQVGAASDNVFWLNACSSENVLLVPGGGFWYRTHAGQELVSARAQQDYMRALRCSWDALNASTCPLEPDEAELAKRNWAWNNGRTIVRDLIGGRFQQARQRWTNCSLTLAEWLHYFRRQQRDISAGTPRDANGEFITPDWTAFTPTSDLSTHE